VPKTERPTTAMQLSGMPYWMEILQPSQAARRCPQTAETSLRSSAQTTGDSKINNFCCFKSQHFGFFFFSFHSTRRDFEVGHCPNRNKAHGLVLGLSRGLRLKMLSVGVMGNWEKKNASGSWRKGDPCYVVMESVVKLSLVEMEKWKMCLTQWSSWQDF
jgi:hypothetical protein